MDVSNGWYIASFFMGAGGGWAWMTQATRPVTSTTKRAWRPARPSRPSPRTLPSRRAMTPSSPAASATPSRPASPAPGTPAPSRKSWATTMPPPLPTFTMNGEQVQMASFSGYKLKGVNTLTAFPEEAMALAEWLTNEESQIKRFEVRAPGPSNIKAAPERGCPGHRPWPRWLPSLSLLRKGMSGATTGPLPRLWHHHGGQGLQQGRGKPCWTKWWPPSQQNKPVEAEGACKSPFS